MTDKSLVERIARAAALEISRQDGFESDGLNDDLTMDYLDQGKTDFAAVARAIIAAAPELAQERGKLGWRPLGGSLEGEEAWSGNLTAGSILYRRAEPRVWVYRLDAVATKWITKGHGEVSSARSAKRAVERAWAEWRREAGL